MLRLKSIKKDYIVADTKVHALKGIDLSFRKNEFVSILGPSGCGKTTLLNIIGGLDKYTEGDLFINGKSTKEFNDRDWDVYRNHRIGFIFQSYNLIPHQTILGNVELALTISGISKAERQERAKKALDKVGLAGQYYKKPNQLSGGQCQRVAIARALVNEPEILLADEPTGALDTVTSVQIMDLIKEIAQEKLVIMVTHNPELAEKYSTRIVRLLDGELQDDSNPFGEEEEKQEIASLVAIEKEKEEKELASINPEDTKALKEYNKNKNAKEKAKMSLWTAFKLSARNLHSKLKRTIMVIIAGSIGIIGVSAVLAVSQGVRDYIESIQDDLLSGNPIQITKSGIDYETLMNSSSFMQRVDAVNKTTEEGKINVNSIVEYLVQNQKALDSLTFQNEFDEDYVSYVMSMPKEYYNTISMRYGMSYDYNIYADYNVSHDENDPNKDLKKEYDGAISLDAINSTYSKTLGNILRAVNIEESKVETYSSLITSLTKPLAQSINFDSENYIKEQYDVVKGHFPGETQLDSNEKEVMLVLDQNEMVSDLMLAQLGYYSQEEFFDIIYNAINDSNKEDPVKSKTPIYVNKDHIKQRFSYEELLGKTFRWYPNDTVFKQDSSDSKKFTYDYKEPTDKTNMITFKVTGILKLKEGTSYGALKSGFVFSESTAKEIIRRNINSKLNEFVRNSIEENKEKGNQNYVVSQITYDLHCYWESINQETGAIVPFSNTNNPENENYNSDYDKFTVGVGETDQTSSIMGLFTSGGGSSTNFSVNDIFGTITEEDYATAASLAAKLKNPAEIIDFIKELTGLFSSKAEKYISNLLTDKRIYIKTFGGTYLPNSINIYPTNFEIKDKVTDYLSDWNKIEGAEAKSVKFNTYNADFSEITGTKTLTADARKEIKYTDTVGLIIGLINTMINIVTYALVSFTALSLIVSTVMIAIITYVSVMERVKEIGVIRSLGGRKKDVSHLFNAEAFIIGALSGVFGVVITYILQLFGNIIINAVSGGVVTAIANLTPLTALIMILVSILLTSISGFIPARSAAKKDPVVALRTE